MKLVVCESLPI
jgi:hypothetical protein